MPRDDATLLDIARVAGLDEAAFLADIKTQSAVLHQLMVLGEAVKRLSLEFRDQHSSIPWALIAGMRDKLIHGYDMVDLDRVWNTAHKDVPNLLAAIDPLLPKQN
ncbi:MAG: DUF86 domain-containing protein [Anaerolineae bacterium]